MIIQAQNPEDDHRPVGGDDEGTGNGRGRCWNADADSAVMSSLSLAGNLRTGRITDRT
jgi:hypothetical protein